MPKRLTLNGLLKFIETITIQNNNISDTDLDTNKQLYSIKSQDIQYIDKIKFKNIKWGEIQTITDFPKKCKKIFDPFISKIKRYGTIVNFSERNISLYFSILFCLFDDFGKMNKKEQETFIDSFIQKLSMDVTRKRLFEKFSYKELKWTQKELRESISKCKNNKIVLRYLADYFNINIFLINIPEDRIYAIYPEEQFNVYKMHIFLTFYEDTFEPLVYNKKLWKYDDGPFKRLIVVNKMHINTFNFNPLIEEKEFVVGPEDLTKYDDRVEHIEPVEPVIEETDKDIEENKYDEVFTNSDSDSNSVYINDTDGTEIEIELGNSKRSTVDIFVKNK